MFSFKLASTGSELYLGGTNPAKYTGSIEPHSVVSPQKYWQISGASIHTGSATPVSNFQTIIDTGTTIMYGPPADVATFYNYVPGSALYDSTYGYYSFPCSSVPSVVFSWGPGGRNWTISAAKYVPSGTSSSEVLSRCLSYFFRSFNFGETTAGSGRCVGALAGVDLGLGTGVWFLGDAQVFCSAYRALSYLTLSPSLFLRFIKNVYAVFDVTANTIGFATLS